MEIIKIRVGGAREMLKIKKKKNPTSKNRNQSNDVPAEDARKESFYSYRRSLTEDNAWN